MTKLDRIMEVITTAMAVGSQGIHLAAQLEIEAHHLRAHRIGWAAVTMEQAAHRIRELEDKLVEALGYEKISIHDESIYSPKEPDFGE